MFTSLNIAISGMRSAQTGLAVTGHNMANAEINGFSRQRSVQFDTRARSLGTSLSGSPLRVGTGVDNQAIHQIRSRFYDNMFREHHARLSFYSMLSSIGKHIEVLLGETHGNYRMQDLLTDMWASLQELSMSPASIETRDMFIATSISFLEKAHNVFDELFEFQQNLDQQIRMMVDEINDTVAQINHLNVVIAGNEMAGDNANDLRDERHRLMDRLSGLLPVQFFEDWETGSISIMTVSGNSLLSGTGQNVLGLIYINPRYNFVEPVFTMSQTVLPFDTPPSRYHPLFNWDRPIGATQNNNEGALMALLSARGAMPATYRGIEALWEPIGLPHDSPDAPFGTIDELVRYMIESRLGDLGAPDVDPVTGRPLIPAVPDALPLDTPIPVYTSFPVAGAPHAAPGWWTPPATWPGYFTGADDPYFVDMLATRAAAVNRTAQALRNQQIWDNELANLHGLYPEILQTPEAFRLAVNAGPGSNADPDHQLFNQLHGRFAGARRMHRQAGWSKQNALIPRVMKQVDQIVNSVVRLINDSIAPVGTQRVPVLDAQGDPIPGQYEYITTHLRCPDAPFDLSDPPERSFVEMFVRRSHGTTALPRFCGDHIFNDGLPGQFGNMYTTRNLMINPLLRAEGGYNRLALSPSGNREDSSLLNWMVEVWGQEDGPFAVNVGGVNFSIDRAYNQFVVNLGIEVRESETHLESEFIQVSQADQRRNAVMGVSLDEELSSMMTFQFAYQAAARLFNIIDSMIDTVVNRTGRVGL